MTLSANCQVSRWSFTLHNYSPTIDYKSYLENADFDIKRAVIGFEQVFSGNGINRHMQGYVEFSRTHRFAFVKNIFMGAHWQRAYGSCKQNYDYCTKSNVYETIGEWPVEDTEKGNCTGTIIRGLLSRFSPQVQCSKEYMARKKEFDSAANLVNEILIKHKNFSKYKHAKLSNWQFQTFNILNNQTQRKILWVADGVGDRGKTWFCNFMNAMYNYFVCNGTMDERDLCYILPNQFNGLLFDLSRDMIRDFNYSILESSKNGFMTTGKYEGKHRYFDPVPVAVMANFLPCVTRLSADRWQIIELGKGTFADASNIGIHKVNTILPYVNPPVIPELNYKVDIMKFLSENLPREPNLQQLYPTSTESAPVVKHSICQ